MEPGAWAANGPSWTPGETAKETGGSSALLDWFTSGQSYPFQNMWNLLTGGNSTQGQANVTSPLGGGGNLFDPMEWLKNITMAPSTATQGIMNGTAQRILGGLNWEGAGSAYMNYPDKVKQAVGGAWNWLKGNN